MLRTRFRAGAALVAGLLAATPAAAGPSDSTGTLYALVTPPSSLEIGCQGPCLCPVVPTPTYGSFRLVRTGVDPLYTNYAVEGYIASFNNGPGAVAITGSGQYRIGGEVALVQQLELDLEIEGRPPVHFDSGVVPVTTPFPAISVRAAVHAFACFDTVIVVDAKPFEVAGVPPPVARVGLEAVRPNPFRGETSIVFDVERPEFVRLFIVDASGRRVRTLEAGRFFSPGGRTESWDGRGDDGRPAPAGVYWVRLAWSGGADSRRFVKLD